MFLSDTDWQDRMLYDPSSVPHPRFRGIDAASSSEIGKSSSHILGLERNKRRRGLTSSKRKPSSINGNSKKHHKPTKEDDNDGDIRNLTTIEIRQLRTRRALRELKCFPSAKAWTDEHQNIIAENLQSLLKATLDPRELFRAATEEEELPQGRSHSPKAQRGSKHQQSGSRTNFKSATKNQNDRCKSPTTGSQRRLKKLRQTPQNRIPVPEMDIVKLNPQPVQMFFHDHPLEDRDDAWFENEFIQLFSSIDLFFEMYFCILDLDEGEASELLSGSLSPEFLNYVQQIAEADPNGENWDVLLKDREQRKWLLVGIMWKILEYKVYNEGLWGATQEEKDLMFGIEKALFTNEGA